MLFTLSVRIFLHVLQFWFLEKAVLGKRKADETKGRHSKRGTEDAERLPPVPEAGVLHLSSAGHSPLYCCAPRVASDAREPSAIISASLLIYTRTRQQQEGSYSGDRRNGQHRLCVSEKITATGSDCNLFGFSAHTLHS